VAPSAYAGAGEGGPGAGTSFPGAGLVSVVVVAVLNGARHGVTVTVLPEALQLLVSSVSTALFPPSAHARRK
jgi:hypothetical protein